MSWVRLDDKFPEHPKIEALDDSSFSLHVKAICYANRNLTDGFVPTAAAARMGGKHFKRSAAHLIDAGLWNGVRDGYSIHDYLDYQPTREEVIATRVATRDQRAAAGRARAAGAKREAGRFLPAGIQRDRWSYAGTSGPADHQPRTQSRTHVSIDTGTTRTTSEERPVDLRGLLKRMPG